MTRMLYLSDVLDFLERLENSSVDLVFMDPPWCTRDADEKSELGTQEDLFADYRLAALQARRVLKENGILVWHLDNNAYGRTRSILDKVFGAEALRTEFILRPQRAVANTPQPKPLHQSLVVYSLGDDFTYNPPVRRLSSSEIKRRFPKEENGQRYRLDNITAPVMRPAFRYAWNGVFPRSGRSWRYSREKMRELECAGQIVTSSSGLPMLKRYMTNEPVVELDTIWDDIPPSKPHQTSSGSRCVAQLSNVLLNRIISTFTNPNDLVLDPFCGSGTTLLEAEQLRRSWIGCDNNEAVISICRDRLSDDGLTAGVGYEWGTHEELLQRYPIVCSTERFVHAAEGIWPRVRTNFNRGASFPADESEVYEFKEVKGNNPANPIGKQADQYAVAFLNSEGGSIFWGVNDDGEIVGVILDRAMRDEIKRIINQKMAGVLPTLAENGYRLTLHQVFDSKVPVDDLFVVELSVPFGHRRDIYFTGSNEAWVRTASGKKKLSGPEIQNEVIRRQNS